MYQCLTWFANLLMYFESKKATHRQFWAICESFSQIVNSKGKLNYIVHTKNENKKDGLSQPTHENGHTCIIINFNTNMKHVLHSCNLLPSSSRAFLRSTLKYKWDRDYDVTQGLRLTSKPYFKIQTYTCLSYSVFN